MKHLLAILLAMAMLFACKHDPDPTEPPTGCGMTIDQFPLKVGNSWTYEVSSFADGNPSSRIGKLKINIIDLFLILKTVSFIAYPSLIIIVYKGSDSLKFSIVSIFVQISGNFV